MKNRFNMINRNWKYMINSGCTVIRFNMIKSKLVLYDLLLWVFWWIKMYDSETVSEILWKNSAIQIVVRKFFPGALPPTPLADRSARPPAG